MVLFGIVTRGFNHYKGVESYLYTEYQYTAVGRGGDEKVVSFSIR